MNKHENLSSRFLLTEMSVEYTGDDAQNEKSMCIKYASNDVDHQIADFDYFYKTVNLQEVLKLVILDSSSVSVDIFSIDASKYDNNKSPEAQSYDRMYSGVSFVCVPKDIDEFAHYIESCEKSKDIETSVDDTSVVSTTWRESVKEGEIMINFIVEICDKDHTDMRDFDEEDVEELARNWVDSHCDTIDEPIL